MQYTLGIQLAQKVDYLMVISPPDEIMSIANELKRTVSDTIGHYKSRGSIPHITFCKSLLTTDREEKIISEWEKLFSTLPVFKITVKGLKVFESSGTLFLETDYPEELRNIRTRFQLKNKELKISKKGYHLISTPHITIARGLNSNALTKLESLISDFSCEKEFSVKSLTGLRADSSDEKYQNSRIFNLKS